MQDAPQSRKHSALLRTHSCCSCVRLLRLAGMEPLSWLMLSDLPRMQDAPQFRNR